MAAKVPYGYCKVGAKSSYIGVKRHKLKFLLNTRHHGFCEYIFCYTLTILIWIWKKKTWRVAIKFFDYILAQNNMVITLNIFTSKETDAMSNLQLTLTELFRVQCIDLASLTHTLHVFNMVAGMNYLLTAISFNWFK